jgi:hypothetical protein
MVLLYDLGMDSAKKPVSKNSSLSAVYSLLQKLVYLALTYQHTISSDPIISASSQYHGMLSGCRWRWTPAMEDICQYSEEAVADNWKSSSLAVWLTSNHRKKEELVTKRHKGHQLGGIL